MRGALVGAATGVTLAVMWSCTVNTRSDQLACKVQADCGTTGRVCESGYCVVDPTVKLDAAIDARMIDAFQCPAACSAGCVPNGQVCMIDGTGSAVTCPAGWNCTISCPTAGACGNITCTAAQSCTVTCGIEGACGNISCGTARCTVGCTGTGAGSAVTACGTVSCTTGACDLTCTGSGACGDLQCGAGACTESCSGSGACGNTACASSCKCDISCNPLLGACGTMTCPTHGSHYCALAGAGTPCNSTVFGNCTQTCP